MHESSPMEMTSLADAKYDMPDRNQDTVDLVVVSHACLRAINRRVYRDVFESGVKVHIIAPKSIIRNGQIYYGEPSEPGDPPIHFLNLKGENGRLMRFEQLSKVLDSIDPKVVLVDADTASILTMAVARWCNSNKRRMACRTCENLSWQWADVVDRLGHRELPLALGKRILNNFLRNSISIVYVFSDQAASIFRHSGFDNVQVIPMGTDRRLFRYSSRIRHITRTEMGIGKQEIVVAYYGRMVQEKGITTLVLALSRLIEIPWRLMLNQFEVSTGYAKTVEQLIDECGIRGRTLRVSSSHGSIARLMNASDVVVLPSISTPKWVEQFGRVVPEAMACGNLLVVSDSGAPKELVGSAGLVFPEGDHDALARVLRDVWRRPQECVARRKAGIRHVHKRLSVDVEAAAYRKLLNMK